MLILCVRVIVVSTVLGALTPSATALGHVPAHVHAKYSHFADMLAGVLLLREGGIEEALAAMPVLINHTRGHIAVRTFFRMQHSSYKAQQAANDALNSKLNALNLKFSKVSQDFVDKVNAPRTPAQARKQAIERNVTDWLNKKLSRINPTRLDAVNAKLGASKLNLQLNPVDIDPSQKFSNSAAIISSSIQGLQAQALGVNYNPCVFSTQLGGLQIHGQAISFSPTLVFVQANVVNVGPTLLNVQPALLQVGPSGAQVAPFGVSVQPVLIGASPVGTFVEPFGITIQPYLQNWGPQGVNIAPTGLTVP